jgi:hypothetical protein
MEKVAHGNGLARPSVIASFLSGPIFEGMLDCVFWVRHLACLRVEVFFLSNALSAGCG